jgi:hypothetical protein
MSGPLEAMALVPLRQKLRDAAAGDATVDVAACQMVLRNLTGFALELDERRIKLLRAHLYDLARSFEPGDLEGLLRAVKNAIERTWPAGERPRVALVLNERFLRNPRTASGNLAPTFALEARDALVRQGLADPGEWQVYDGLVESLSIFETNLLFDQGTVHSALRWLDPAGDRNIVVLPSEYDA